MSKHIVKLTDTENNIPVVRFHIGNGQAGYAIIDTGSEVSIFDTDFVSDNMNSFEKTDSTPYGVSHIAGADLNTQSSYYSTTVTVGEDNPMSFSMAALSYPIYHLSKFFEESRENINVTAIIGTDVLSKTRVDINFETKEITLNDDLLSK